LIGLAVSAILMVVVPDAYWKGLFLSGNSSLPHFLVLSWNAIIGIFIAIIAFVCSVGNIVMAAVLWQGGISFGGGDSLYTFRPGDYSDADGIP